MGRLVGDMRWCCGWNGQSLFGMLLHVIRKRNWMPAVISSKIFVVGLFKNALLCFLIAKAQTLCMLRDNENVNVRNRLTACSRSRSKVIAQTCHGSGMVFNWKLACWIFRIYFDWLFSLGGSLVFRGKIVGKFACGSIDGPADSRILLQNCLKHIAFSVSFLQFQIE